MPIYEYQCPKCGTFELTQRITDKPLGKCPSCKAKVKKLISNTSFQLKGTGWYITDYARKGKGQETGASNGENGAKPSGEAKSETKKAPKSEPSSTATDKPSSSSAPAQ